MTLALEFLIVGISILVIAKSADWVVDSAAKIASRFHVSQLVIGLTIVAFGTSAPEFAVSLSAALRGIGNIAVANVVGSNIFNILIILGVCAVVRPIITTEKLVKRDCLSMFLGTLMVSAFIYDLTIERVEGVILFSCLILYVGFLAWKKEVPGEIEIPAEKAKRFDAILLVIGLAGVIGGAHFLVSSSVAIAQTVGISEWVIGVTLIAFGTSVPELAVSVMAVIKKYYAISAGNLIGSNIFNILGVIGFTGMLTSMSFDIAVRFDIFIMVGSVVLVTLLMKTGWIVSRKEGLLLILVGIIWWYKLLILD